MMAVQMTWDQFTPKEPMRRHHHLVTDGVWDYCTVMKDAETIIRDLGRLPRGGCTCDRLMESGAPNPLRADLMNPEDRELHYWSHNTRGYLKRIRFDGTVTDWLIIHRKGGPHGWSCERHQITGARIQGDELVFETEKADYGMEIRPARHGSMCNFISEPYDPATYTEHLMIHALGMGRSPAEIRRFMDVRRPVCLSYYHPFTRNAEGEMVPSETYDEIMGFAKALGVIPKVSFDVQPYRPWIKPIARRRYCNIRRIGACKVSDNGGCVGCDRFYSTPDTVIAPNDRYDAKNRPKMAIPYEEEDE